MREIKFRVWDKRNKTMFKIFDSVTQEDWYLPHWKDLYEVMQYTGLRDSKRTEEYPDGQEIYEGDIVYFSIFDHNGSDTQYKGVVKWNNAMFEIWYSVELEYFGHDGGFVLAWAHSQDDEFEVIGNIYENPELLK